MKVKERELAQLCLTLCYPMDCSPPGFSYSWNFPGKSTGVGWHFLLQGMFLAQGLNLGLLHWRQMLLPSEPPGKPNKAKSFCKELVQLGLTLPFKKIPLLLKKKIVDVVYHIDWFADIKESLHSWDKAHLVMVYDFFNMLLDSVC